MEPFTKIVRLGSIWQTDPETNKRLRAYGVYCQIRYDETGELHITGVEGPYANGNCWGSCGQIIMGYRDDPSRLDRLTPAPEWTREDIEHFFAIWDKYHLNHMKAGSPAQTAILNIAGYDRTKDGDHYTWAQKVLAEHKMNPDPSYLHNGEPYRYGSAWLKIDVPDEVLTWLNERPVADKEPAWV